MRTPVILVAGQQGTDTVAAALLRTPGTLVVEHRFDGDAVQRTMTTLQRGLSTTSEAKLELDHGCPSCTIRNDLLVLLRQLHRCDGVDRIVVQLAPWLEPEPICIAIHHVRVRVAPGYIDGPAALDVSIAAVVACVDSSVWLRQVLGDAVLDDGRSRAQVVACQAEFADLVVLNHGDPLLAAILRRLSPRARIHVGADGIEHALDNLYRDARRGQSDDPHAPLLAGQPPLDSRGPISLIEFNSRRPFHPQRLHACLDLLLDGVIRSRGRLWLASENEQAMWWESAGGGLRISSAGRWLAALTGPELAKVDAERRVFAELRWDEQYGDRHTAMTVLVYSANPAEILRALEGALLTDAEFRSPQEWLDYEDPFGDWPQDLREALPEQGQDRTARDTQFEGRR
ncbi:MAG: GTP-binding protein [Actinomycetota bacterium]|uniref:ribosome hibernation factor-recruiting GTPase MRF n=1 Tax=Mycobacterium lentiflavum TaxID=141349 RepID=UPI002E850994|nr:GTP-binding protein [Actinomycetota bacterium]